MTETVELTYHLGELPSASYRAGLAGLVFLIHFLHRDKPEINDQIQIIYDSTNATLKFNQKGLQALMDLAFDSQYELKWSKNKINDPVEIKETENGKLYGWNSLRVTGAALQEKDPGGLWTSLWSDWLLKTVRAFPKSREVFKLRVNHEPIKTQKIWNALKKPSANTGLSSSSLIGAEAKTGEGTKLNSLNYQEFLLNFWTYVSQPYVPCRFDPEGKREDWGYTVAIPDVQDLESFISGFPNILERRPQNPPEYKGYRPLGALIELPEEAALDSIRLIRQYMQETQISSSLEFDVLGFEVCHAIRPDPKKGADLISITYIQPEVDRDVNYANYRKKFICPWFRRHLLQNLVKNHHWTRGWATLLSTASQKWFEHRYFPHDCRVVFNFEENIVETSELIQILKSLCDRYLNARLASKGESTSNWEEKHKLARQEFLTIRGRTQEKAFREYFYGTLCSQVTPVIPHKKGEKSSDDQKLQQMVTLATALEQDAETVRGLTMLALASNFQFSNRSDSNSGSNES